MTVEFGTIHQYSSLEENSEAFFVQFFFFFLTNTKI